MSAEKQNLPVEQNQEDLAGQEDPQLEIDNSAASIQLGEEPATHEGSTGLGETDDEGMGSYPARRRGRGRAGRRGTASSLLPTAPEVVPATPEPETEATTEEPAHQPIYNRGTIAPDVEKNILGSRTTAEIENGNQDAIDAAIEAYAAKHTPGRQDLTERPDTSGTRQSYRVELGPSSQAAFNTARVNTEPQAETTTSEEDDPWTDTEGPEVRASESANTEPTPEPSRPARRTAANSGGDLYTQLRLAENPLATSRDDLRGVARGGLETTGAPVLSSREIRDQQNTAAQPAQGESVSASEPATPETTETTEPTVEPQPRGRHRRRGHSASLLQRAQGYTTAPPEATPVTQNNPDNEATQPIPTVNLGEAAPAEPERRRGITQRLRGRIGQLATRMGIRTNEERVQDWEIRRNGISNGLEPGEARPIRLATEEERSRPQTNLRRRAIGTIGLIAASAGLMSGISGDMSRDERPRAAISASQLPSQELGGISKGIGDQVKGIQESLQRQADNAQAGGEQSGGSNEQQPSRTTDVGNEKITISNDGSVVIELEKNGTYWDGVHEAERLLNIDDSATATANAVNTIGFEKGEDRNQKVGAKVAFKNVGGKLVASRS